MKIVVMKNSLKEGLSIVEKSSTENSSLPILKNVLFEAVGEKIKLTTTNLEVGIVFHLSGKVLEEGKITIPVNTLSSLVNNLINERVELEVKDKRVHIKTEEYEGFLDSLPAEDFPLIPKNQNTDIFIEIEGESLKDALSQTIPSAQTTDLRPELNSVFFSFTLDQIVFAATDSFRLAEKKISENQFKTNNEELYKYLIPLKTAQELVRIINPGKKVKIFKDPNQVVFQTDIFEFTSRIIDGNFPDYQAIIPQTHQLEVILEKNEFINSIKLVQVVSNKQNEIKLKINSNDKNIQIYATEQGVGENTYTLPAKITGESKEINFNSRYLLDGLKTITTTDVILRVNEDNKPTIIKSTTDASFLYLIMPILKP